VVDIGYAKQRDLALELPPTPLEAVMSNDQWDAGLRARGRTGVAAQDHAGVRQHAAHGRARGAPPGRHRLGKEAVAAHHGSLSKEIRLDAEQRLKRGELKVLVATASLELGLDIGDVDLVCQLGSPRAIATFLQRAGRSGHAVGGVPKARLFPTVARRTGRMRGPARLRAPRRTRRAARAARAAGRAGAADRGREWPAASGTRTSCSRWCAAPGPTRSSRTRATTEVVRMVAEGFTTRQGQRAGYVHRDAVNHLLRERKGARMTALTSGGTIPETGDYTVVLEPQADKIGTVNEDFAVESLAGDVFQLGNTSYRILKIEPGRVRVEDAHGAAPNIPFWLGEAPGRSDELSMACRACAPKSSSSRWTGRRPRPAMKLADGTLGLKEKTRRARSSSTWRMHAPCWARCRRRTRW
jgi:ATP-dependent Lhr-like helicase